MKRFDYFFRQKVTEDEMDEAFEGAEQADRDIVKDLFPQGVASGLGVTQASPTANLTVQVAAGTAYDDAGQRIRVPSVQALNLAVDSNGASTSVGSGGNAKVVSVFAQFTRALSDPRVDGNSATVYWERGESFAFVVRQGTEATAGSETPVALEAGKILLCDVQRTFGQTQILDANINPTAYTNRRQDAYVGASGIVAYRYGLIKDVVEYLRTQMNDAIISPTAIGTNQNNYNPTSFSTCNVVRQSLTTGCALTGLAARSAGQRVRIYNISTSANTLTLNHEDGASTADNRFICPNLANFALRAGGMALVWYDGTSTRWRVEAA